VCCARLLRRASYPRHTGGVLCTADYPPPVWRGTISSAQHPDAVFRRRLPGKDAQQLHAFQAGGMEDGNNRHAVDNVTAEYHAQRFCEGKRAHVNEFGLIRGEGGLH
jgi:hypothetical protein